MGPIEKDDHFIPDGINASERNIKCIGDCTPALSTLVVFSSLFLLHYIAVKREDGGPAIFKQERTGRFGCPFSTYKFHSMKLDAEGHGPTLYAGRGDSRMTRVGRFLYGHHLDKLPQLWDMFCGDMVFIGPRLEYQSFIDQVMKEGPCYRYLFQICPSVTSYVILYGGYTDILEKMLRRLRCDLFYLEHRPWGSDIRILLMTSMGIVFEKRL